MKPAARLVAPVLVGLLAACGGSGDQAEAERTSAVGDVLGGSINDEMLPLDTITSQSPALREQASGAAAGSRASASAAANDAEADEGSDDAAPDADEAPAPEAAAEPEAVSEE